MQLIGGLLELLHARVHVLDGFLEVFDRFVQFVRFSGLSLEVPSGIKMESVRETFGYSPIETNVGLVCKRSRADQRG